ncbi:hypothetical protein L596_015666 [Steinernema carpocapsae]|uniref:Uncharacterized protein n=1 Tax=Steinernema carpocapsae TaxID=34508 RepID=A0A4U5NGX3_STECR|nr:hypothetical protein L596_015666 [Steinernema carpocapsae]
MTHASGPTHSFRSLTPCAVVSKMSSALILLINVMTMLLIGVTTLTTSCKTSSKKATAKVHDKDVLLTKSIDTGTGESGEVSKTPTPPPPKGPPPNVPIAPKRKNDDTLRNVPSLKQEEPSSG